MRMAIALVILMACGGSEKPKKNEDWKKPWHQYQGTNGRPRAVGVEGTPKTDRPVTTMKTLEDAATALIRFHRRTGRRCPTKDERRDLMVGSYSLETLARRVFVHCASSSGFYLAVAGDARLKRHIALEPGCRAGASVVRQTGPLLPSRPDPEVEKRRTEATLKEQVACLGHPTDTIVACEGDECQEVEVDAWLSAHPTAKSIAQSLPTHQG